MKDAQHQDTYFRTQLESARQGENQTLWEFHNYLASLEDHFHYLPESERALAFLAKLRPELRRHIELYGGSRPDNRLGMVNIAQSYWEQLKFSNQKKHVRQDSFEHPKKSRKIHQGGGGSTPFSTPNWSMKGGKEVQNQSSEKSSKSHTLSYTAGHILCCFECGSDTHLIKDCKGDSYNNIYPPPTFEIYACTFRYLYHLKALISLVITHVLWSCATQCT